MLNSFLISFKLKNTYKANSIIFTIKSLPFLKKILPAALYASKGLKTFANIVSLLYEIVTIFLGKVLYLMLMVLWPLIMMQKITPDAFLHVFFFLTLVGSFTNTYIFNPTKDKYYAIFLMRMDAKRYALANYMYFQLKTAIGFLPFTILLSILGGVSLAVGILAPFFVCGVKLVVLAFVLSDFSKKKQAYSENQPTVWIIIAVGLVLAFVPIFLGYTLNSTIFLAAAIFFILAGALSFKYIWDYSDYTALYRDMLSDNQMIINPNAVKNYSQDQYRKKIEISTLKTSNRKGYAYFNDIFIQRHAKILMRPVRVIALILLGVVLAAAVATFFVPKLKTSINQGLQMYLPYSLLVMYFLNRGRNLTGSMFANCDSSMLTYRFYRQPKAILSLFAERIKSVSSINLIPAIVLAVGLPLLLWVSGGTDNALNYFLIFISILSMSVFFSVHTLVLYYLFQPFNAKIEMKNPIYQTIDSLTYFVCYFAAGKALSTLQFGLGITVFCVLYIIVALVLVYKFAPKTFKVR